MDGFLERLEAMGRTGGMIAVAVSACLFAASAGLVIWSMGIGDDQGQWTLGGIRFLAFILFAIGLPTAFVGTRLLTQKQYPSASEVFPSVTVEEILEALANRTEDVCVCTRCQVMVPALYSTGSCPVCASSVEYHEVHDDEDAKMVIASLS